MDSLTERFVVPVMLGAEAALSEVDLSMVIGDTTGGAQGLDAVGLDAAGELRVGFEPA